MWNARSEMAAVTEPRKRSARGEGERLRTELLDAAAKLLYDTGDPDAVSIRAVALAVGVTPPSVYRHFPDKLALLNAAALRTFAEFRHGMTAAAEGHADPLDRLLAQGKYYLAFARTHPGHYSLLFGEGRARLPGLAEMPAGTDGDEGLYLFADLVASVTSVIEAHGRRDLEPVATSVVVWTALHGLIELQKCKGEFPWPDDDSLLTTIGALFS
jgi:AcrR family transcriptional regulator